MDEKSTSTKTCPLGAFIALLTRLESSSMVPPCPPSKTRSTAVLRASSSIVGRAMFCRFKPPRDAHRPVLAPWYTKVLRILPPTWTSSIFSYLATEVWEPCCLSRKTARIGSDKLVSANLAQTYSAVKLAMSAPLALSQPNNLPVSVALHPEIATLSILMDSLADSTAIKAFFNSSGSTGTPRSLIFWVSTHTLCSCGVSGCRLRTMSISVRTSCLQYSYNWSSNTGSSTNCPLRLGLHSLVMRRLPTVSFCSAVPRNMAASSKPCGMLLAAAIAMESIIWSHSTSQPNTYFMMWYSNAAFHAWNWMFFRLVVIQRGSPRSGVHRCTSPPLIE